MPKITTLRRLGIVTIGVLAIWTVLRLVLAQWLWAIAGIATIMAMAAFVVWLGRQQRY